MYRKFLNARSPLRLLEKGLHGGLGKGNLGVVLAGHGVGKSAVLVGVALDDLLRQQRVLHVGLDQTVNHVKTYYDTVFEELANSTHLEELATVRADIERLRSIRTYTAQDFSSAKLREAVKIETEVSSAPVMIVVDDYNLEDANAEEVQNIKALAQETGAEVWLSTACGEEKIGGIPESISALGDQISVVLALEPDGDSLGLRALKDHENPDLSELHVALDPKSLLLIRH